MGKSIRFVWREREKSEICRRCFQYNGFIFAICLSQHLRMLEMFNVFWNLKWNRLYLCNLGYVNKFNVLWTFLAVSTSVSLVLSSVFAVLLFSTMQLYRPWFASTQWNTILGGYIGSWLFILALTVRSYENHTNLLFFKFNFRLYRLFQILSQLC